MENFLKPFLEKGVVYSLESLTLNADDNAEFDFIKLLHKIIFKHDVVIEFKRILNLACTPESFTVKNDLVKKVIVHLNLLLLSNVGAKKKADVFRLIFESFALMCKGDDIVYIIRFLVVLSHLLGMNAVPDANEDNETETFNSVINIKDFNRAFEICTVKPSLVTFSIFKELLVKLSKLPVNFNSSEYQIYSKWLQLLTKNLAYVQPLESIFLEIFSICADIDLRLLEGNSEHIFCNVLTQRPPVDEDFCNSYSAFFEKALDISSKFQRTPKLIKKFLSSVKATPTLLVKDIILPPKVLNEFSKIVGIASNQQSLLLFESLLQNLEECLNVFSINNSGSNPLVFLLTSDLLISFLKEVKLFAPSIANVTLQTFIEKLNTFKTALQKFGTCLFNNTSFMVKNETIAETFFELCLYCGEIELLINCYKDSVLQPSDATATECDWQCCLRLEQWKNLINLVLNSKLEFLSPVCFRLALQKCRESRLKNSISDIDESTLKIVFSQLTSGLKKFDFFQQLPPEDLTILMEVLTVKQSKLICKKIFKRLLETDTKTESTAWLCNSALQENSVFVLNLFSQIMKETGSVLPDLIPDKTYSKISWLLDEYFDDRHNISAEKMEGLSEKISYLLRNAKKIRKFITKNPKQKVRIHRIVEVFKLLPLPYLRGDCHRLGLCYAVKMAVLLSEDESSVCAGLESICNFLVSDVDASLCFDVGLCVKWLSEISYEDKRANELRLKIIEILVRNSPNMKFGLHQIGEMIDSGESFKPTSQLKMLEGRVFLYNELGKSWQRAKKRKSDNDLIGMHRSKLAKIISEEAEQLQEDSINSENSKILLKILTIQLHKAIKENEESEISVLMEQKFPSYFDFAVKSLKSSYDESSALFLTIVLQLMPQIRKYLPRDSLSETWKALRFYEKVNWRLFSNHSTDEEFTEILDDLVKMSKKFLNSDSEKYSSDFFEIWVVFFEVSSESKKSLCQLRLQEFFNYIHSCDLLLKDLPMRKKIFLIKFSSFCVSKKEVILTSHILDTIIHIMLECPGDSSSVEDFSDLFVAKVETASAILLRRFDWSKSKLHLTFVFFKIMLASLMKRCEVGHQINQDDVIKLSTCAFCVEKWVSLLIKKDKDFARTTPYFITALVSSVASVTVLPAIKIHLVNCINHFLSISDSHTVSYLLRILKPGYQQVFNSMYNQFKKYHKYSGKI